MTIKYSPPVDKVLLREGVEKKAENMVGSFQSIDTEKAICGVSDDVVVCLE